MGQHNGQKISGKAASPPHSILSLPERREHKTVPDAVEVQSAWPIVKKKNDNAITAT